MKNLFTFILTIAFLNVFAVVTPETNCVTTKDGTYYLQDLRFGITNFLVGKDMKGEKVIFKKDEVKRFYIDGNLYEKVRKVKDGKMCEDCEFMQLIAYKNGVKAYKFTDYDLNGNLYSELYVFKDGKYVITFTEENYKYLIDYFKGKLVY